MLDRDFTSFIVVGRRSEERGEGEGGGEEEEERRRWCTVRDDAV